MGMIQVHTFIVDFNLLPPLIEQELPIRGLGAGDPCSKRTGFKGR